jgi:hypothetical protein
MSGARRTPSDSRIVFTTRDKRLLELVRRFQLLSRDQVMALAPFGSLTRANTRLAALVSARLLSRKRLPIYPGQGSAQALYFLGTQSEAALAIDSAALVNQVRRISRWDYRQVEHVVAANRVLCDALRALDRGPDAQILAFRTEPELRRLFADRSLVPDGWFAWTESGKRFNCFVEVDLHHEGLREWRGKVLRYLEYAESGLHRERFGFGSFRVCVLAKSLSRVNHLKQLSQTAGRLFLFAEFDCASAGGVFGPVWFSAQGDSRIKLTEA